ncbi:MAG: helix-turn-helix transcriptional regulator [Bacteroidetes bacterium]|nr:helix-turn-helix transcriptional regulator [Bacteroidota bacterium]
MPKDKILRLELGSRIRELRSSKSMTGQKLAKISRISPAYLSEVERGLSVISGEKLLRIAEALGVGLQELLSPELPAGSKNEMISIPDALSEVADELHLSFRHTRRILQGAQSLTARRSSGLQEKWTKEKWLKFYERVKFMLEE